MNDRWRRWGATLSVGVIDQLVVSGTNFGVNIVLARWLPPAEYGAFAVAFAGLLLAAGPHSALLTDAMSVVGARRAQHDGGKYLRSLIIIHAALTVGLGLVIAALGFSPVAIIPQLSPMWFAALGLTTPLVLSLWLTRSACYLREAPRSALAGSSVYAITFALAISVARAGGWLTALRALLMMGVASGVAAVQMAAALGVLNGTWRSLDVRDVMRQHWAYGRWILAASIANAVANGLYVPLLGALLGLEKTAVFRAMQNLVMPLQQLLTGVMMVVYPFVSRQTAQRGVAYIRHRGPAIVLATLGAASAYGLLITGLRQPLVRLMYGSGNSYAAFSSLVPLFALAAVALALAQVLGILVRAINQPAAVLWAKLASAVWLVVLGIALVRANGLTGAIWSLAIGAALETLVLTAILLKAAWMARGI